MATSFVVGATKILDGTEPRFVVLSGREYELKRKLLNVYAHADTEHVLVHDPSAVEYECFLSPLRPFQTKTIIIKDADSVSSWDWLPIWFNKVKRVRIVALTNDPVTAELLESKANTRGLVVECSAPSGSGGKTKLAKMIAGWYNQPQAHINALLFRTNWNVSLCLQLLEKLRLLNLPLTSDTMMTVGLVAEPNADFVAALADGNTPIAMATIPKILPENYFSIVAELSQWLDKIARVKFAYSPMKSVHELAREIGEPKQDIERLQKQSRKYDVERINKLAFVLAFVDQMLAAGNSDGVLEVLVNSWQ